MGRGADAGGAGRAAGRGSAALRRAEAESRAEPSRAEPSRAEPSRAEPSRAEPSRDVAAGLGAGRAGGADPGGAQPVLRRAAETEPGAAGQHPQRPAAHHRPRGRLRLQTRPPAVAAASRGSRTSPSPARTPGAAPRGFRSASPRPLCSDGGPSAEQRSHGEQPWTRTPSQPQHLQLWQLRVGATAGSTPRSFW